jgi:hypothetical protein
VSRTVGHAQDSRPGVLELKVLVSELGTVDALASRPVVVGEIPLPDEIIKTSTVRRELRHSATFLPGNESLTPWHMKPGITIVYEKNERGMP